MEDRSRKETRTNETQFSWVALSTSLLSAACFAWIVVVESWEMLDAFLLIPMIMTGTSVLILVGALAASKSHERRNLLDTFVRALSNDAAALFKHFRSRR